MNRYVMAAGSLGVGLAIAFFMQNTGGNRVASASVLPGVGATADEPRAMATDKTADGTPLDISELEPTAASVPAEAAAPAALSEPPVVKVAADGPTPEIGPGEDVPVPGQSPLVTCPVDMSGVPGEAAMVTLEIEATCMAGSQVTLHHNGMMFTDMLDDTGRLTRDVPALDRNAVFIAALPNGEGAVTVVPVLDLADFARVAVQWKGPMGVELHAREFGAAYGADHHHWSGAMGDMSMVASGEGGFVTRLGEGVMDDRLTVEVYTFPLKGAARSGEVILSVESAVTAGNCGQTVSAQTIEVMPEGEAPKVQDLTIHIPECDAVGDYLVLQDVLTDLQVAAAE